MTNTLANALFKSVGAFAMALLAPSSAFGGQSIVLNNQTAQNASVPAVPSSTPWISETYVDVIPASLASNPWFLKFNEPATGLSIELSDGCAPNLCLNTSVGTESGTSGATCNTTVGNNLPTLAFYIRFQHLSSALTDSCEIWDSNGNLVYQNTSTFTGITANINGVHVIGTSDLQHIAFTRTCTGATVALGSRMPVTAGGCPAGTELFEWKFDGNLNDASGNGYNATLSSGTASFAQTFYQNVISVPRTLGAPFWSNWVSLRAGQPGQLDAGSSFSQADSSSAVTCFWQMLASPSPPTWSDHASCTPTLTGLIFGGYTAQLTVTDSAGVPASATLHFGVVATDSKGVVVHANPVADQIFGPMIAFGKNPWAFQDKTALLATTTRAATYNTFPGSPPSWETALPGTVSYPFIPIAGTTLNGAITATALSLVVHDATQLDLTSFPTIIQLGTGEEIKVCSASGNTFTVCYDGRGYRFGSPSHAAAAAQADATPVKQYRVTGSGTSLMATFNPLGPGWSGLLISNGGTVSATHSSTSITGSGGQGWTNLGVQGYGVRISGTHGSTPFTFLAYVASVTDSTHLVLNRVYPNDADDATGLTYSIFKPDTRNMVLHFGACGTGAYPGCIPSAYPFDGSTYYFTDECVSDTACYLYGGFDPNSVHPSYSTCLSSPPYAANSMECGVHVSYMDGLGYVGDNFGVNFYDEGLAHYALYARSGWQPALDAFRNVEGQDLTGHNGWMFYPELAQGLIGVQPRRASILGAWAAYLLDGKTSNLSGLRAFASKAISNTTNFSAGGGCNGADLREGIAYPQQWLAAAALWDPNATPLGYPAALSNFYSTWSACAGSGSPLVTNSWASGFLWANNQTVPLTATHGSAIVTGTNIAPGICGTTPSATGTATVVNGSDVVTSSGFVSGGGKIMFEDSVLGLLAFDYIFDSASQVHLSGRYPGSNATGVVWWINTDSSFNGTGFDSSLAFATSNADPQLAKQWNCTWNNSSQITLDRPWDGPNANGTLFGWRGNLGGVGVAGFGTQPFFVGLSTVGHRLAGFQPGSLGANFTALGTNAATWVKTFGYNPASGGLYYGRIYPSCEPVYADSSQPQNFPEGYINPQCAYNGSTVAPNFAQQISRALGGEAQNAASLSYASDSSSGNLAFWDRFYCNMWDQPGYTAGGLSCDGLGAYNAVNNNYTGGKWTGFFFGIGMSHQWPASRLGGVAPAVNRTVTIGYSLALAPNAVKAVVILTSPSGAVSTTTCASSPCAVTADARQGAHILQVQYLDGNSKVLAQSEPMTILIQ